MLCIGGTQVEVYMKHIMERTLTFFRMALSTYLQTAVGYILEIFVSEKKKKNGKVLQSIIPIIYLIGSISISITHWKLYL